MIRPEIGTEKHKKSGRIKSAFFFLKTAISNFTQVGSIIPSSGALIKKLVSFADLQKARYVVEFGPGTGCLTREILKRSSPMTEVISIELNPHFHKYLKERINDHRFNIYNENAANLKECMCKHNTKEVDYIFSSLPFMLFPKMTIRKILRETYSCLAPKGKFILFQYSANIEDLLKSVFQEVKKHHVMLNVPPATVFVCSKEKTAHNIKKQ